MQQQQQQQQQCFLSVLIARTELTQPIPPCQSVIDLAAWLLYASPYHHNTAVLQRKGPQVDNVALCNHANKRSTSC